jgi:hypothetical protein
VGQQPAASLGRVRRRPVLRALDVCAKQQPHAGHLPDELRLHAQRLSLDGGVAQLRAGQRERQPAGIRGAARSAGSAGGWVDQLGGRVPAGESPGRGLPGRPRGADRRFADAGECGGGDAGGRNAATCGDERGVRRAA